MDLGGKDDLSTQWLGGTDGCGKVLPPERQHTAWCRFVASLNEVAIANEHRGEITPLQRCIYNMRGGPLNVMEVVRMARSQYEWRINIS